MKRITLRMPDETAEAVDWAAGTYRISQNQLIVEAVEYYLREHGFELKLANVAPPADNMGVQITNGVGVKVEDVTPQLEKAHAELAHALFTSFVAMEFITLAKAKLSYHGLTLPTVSLEFLENAAREKLIAMGSSLTPVRLTEGGN